MKKVSFFVIILTFILSFILVNSFGLKLENDTLKVYLSTLEITNVDITYDINNNPIKNKIIDFDEEKEYTSILISRNISPNDAPGVATIRYELKDAKYSTKAPELMPNLELVFYEPSQVVVELIATDGSNLRDRCTYTCRKPRKI